MESLDGGHDFRNSLSFCPRGHGSYQVLSRFLILLEQLQQVYKSSKEKHVSIYFLSGFITLLVDGDKIGVHHHIGLFFVKFTFILI